MKKSPFYYFLLVSIICWLIPFVFRVSSRKTIDVNLSHNTSVINPHAVVNEILDAHSKDNNKTVFFLICKNNQKNCILNIAGGVILGIGTILNLMFNGFVFADVVVGAYKSGLSIDAILRVTLPHSFELVGVWLSGAIGFYVAWNIFQFMCGKGEFDTRFYKKVGKYYIITFFIILTSAYVEAYISMKK